MGESIGRYEIRVIGHLAARWSAFFEGMTLTAQDDGTTVIHGPVTDQSALHGLIGRLSDLGLPLVSVRPAADQDRIGDPTDQPVEALPNTHPSRRSTT